MTSNKFKAAGYKITVKPCKASPPVFVWPPLEVLAHLQMSGETTPGWGYPHFNVQIDHVYHCQKQTPPGWIVWVREQPRAEGEVLIELYCNIANSTINALVEIRDNPYSMQIASDNQPWTQGASKTYLFEEWPLVDHGELFSARLSVLI